MNLTETLYDWGISAASRTLPRAPYLPEKLRRGIDGRRELRARFEAWAGEHRSDAPLIWFHAPSVGEGLQTRPVIESVRQLRPDVQIVYTFFSPSAESLAEKMPADYADYMPFDVVDDLMPVVEAVNPDAIVFGKLDVWPNLTRVAGWREARLGLISGTVAGNSSRLRWPARSLLTPAYRRLDAAGAISQEDAQRLVRLGVQADRVKVTGDARFDQVMGRAQRIDRGAPPLSLLGGHEGPTLVAGSTWPDGERHLVSAVAKLRSVHAALSVVIVPHEPTPDRLEELEATLDARGLSHVRYTEVEGGAAVRDTVVVDRVGILGELYALADIAYVGGGFGRAGLHSVLEPAALGVPVIFGPRHANAREAGELIDRGGAASVEDSGALEGAIDAWLSDVDARKRAGVAAYDYVREHRGAGRRNAELVVGLLGS